MASSGIQELMSAETKASQVVAEARAARSERMKEAKKEAESIINSYRAEKEAAYQASMQKTLGSSGMDKEALERKTDESIKALQADFAKNESTVLNLLVNEVCDVKCVVPEGLKRNVVHAS